jgi:hypothetical protein
MFYFSDIISESRSLLNDQTPYRYTTELLTEFSYEAVREIHRVRPDSRINSSGGVETVSGLYSYTASDLSAYMEDYDHITGWDRFTYPTLFAKMYVDSTDSITAYADAGDSTHVVVTSAAHGLSDGMTVTISGSTNYNGIFTISSVTTNTFEIVDTWVADDAAGTWVNNTVRFYISEANRTGDTGEVAEVKRVGTTGIKTVRALNSSGWGGTVELLSVPATTTTWDVWANEKEIPLDDIFRMPMVDYIVSRCFNVDSEDQADLNLSQLHYNKFLGGIK